MATIIACSIPATIRASSGSGFGKKSDPNLKKHVSTSTSASWWAPLFGVSSDPDYVVGSSENLGAPGLDPSRIGQRISKGCFTEEKAKQLRRKTAEISSFHDKMYHSAIAARLASDVSGQAEK